jgi:hypothetical protein
LEAPDTRRDTSAPALVSPRPICAYSARVPDAFVFVSQPTALSPQQLHARDVVFGVLAQHRLLPRTVGMGGDRVTKNPLREVCVLASNCSGALILGFRQMEAVTLVRKPGTSAERTDEHVLLPTPWNHLETGVVYALRLPILVIRERGVEGGVFDLGSSELFVNEIDVDTIDEGDTMAALADVIASWGAEVGTHYRGSWA